MHNSPKGAKSPSRVRERTATKRTATKNAQTKTENQQLTIDN